jgi:cytochrome c-type biogenesis protein CcmE
MLIQYILIAIAAAILVSRFFEVSNAKRAQKRIILITSFFLFTYLVLFLLMGLLNSKYWAGISGKYTGNTIIPYVTFIITLAISDHKKYKNIPGDHEINDGNINDLEINKKNEKNNFEVTNKNLSQANYKTNFKGLGKIGIFVIVLISVAMALIINSYDDSTTYETFEVAAENPNKEYRILGELDREKEVYYDPKKDANFLNFYLIDTKGRQQKVVHYAPQPQDFDKSEKVVIIGEMKGDEFIASKILLKCPSKYTDNKLKK